jgi:hypothetical protein
VSRMKMQGVDNSDQAPSLTYMYVNETGLYALSCILIRQVATPITVYL